jgi:hypothetical protein
MEGGHQIETQNRAPLDAPSNEIARGGFSPKMRVTN